MSDNDRGLDRLLELVRGYAGLDFPNGRRASAERPIRVALDRLGLGSVEELAEHVAQPRNVGDLASLAAALTIGETHFFRNRPQLDALREVVLPEIVKRQKDRRRLRIWSAGCSTGEEAYSLAMTLDMVLPDQSGWTVDIVGTDINTAALEKARQAVYGDWSFRGVSDGVLDRYFQRQGRLFRLDRRICESVRFRQVNLTDAAELGQMAVEPFDLILCRNVLIYFRPDTVEQVVAGLERALAPGGWLVTGHAESPMPVFRRLLAVTELSKAVLYRKRDADTPTVAGLSTPPYTGNRLVGGAAGDPMSGDHPTGDASPAGRSQPQCAPAQDEPVSRAEGANTSQPSSVVVQALALVAHGDRQGALDLLHADAERHPTDPTPLVAAARILAGALQFDAANHVIQVAIARDPGVATTHYVHALILQGAGHPDGALAALRRTTYLDPQCALAYVTLAMLMDERGDTVRARGALDRVLQLLAGRDDDTLVDVHEDLTVAGLRHFVAVRRQLMQTEVTA